jgi:hypothetical protein
MFQYDPPGGLDDLSGRPTRQSFLDDWHTFISGEMIGNIALLKNPRDQNQNLADTPIPNPLFFSEVDTPATSADLPVNWNAFPLAINRKFGTDRVAAWKFSETLQSTDDFSPPKGPVFHAKFRPQDEYCEWHVYRDPVTNAISRVVFTSEGPEYWIRLAKADFDQVVSLYQKYVSPKVAKSDLQLAQDITFGPDILRKSTYNPFNVWNTEQGLVHLTHPANTLGAEINLAARSTAMRHDNTGTRITETRRLVCCSGFGSSNRSSDPTIGQAVNITALGNQPGDKPQSITLANPVALYMDSLAAGTLTDEEGSPLDDWFTFVRGVQGRGLMALVAPPPGDARTLEKLRVKGSTLGSGAQIAEAIQMVLYAKTSAFNGPAPPVAPCVFHCCMPSGTPPAKIKDLNLDQPAASDACGQGQADAFPEIASPAGPPAAGASPLAKAGPIWRRTRLGIEQ